MKFELQCVENPEGEGIARCVTAPTVLVGGGINHDAGGPNVRIGPPHNARGQQPEVEGSRGVSAIGVRVASQGSTWTVSDGQPDEGVPEDEARQAVAAVPTEADLANRRHAYAFFALKFILGMSVEFALFI